MYETFTNISMSQGEYSKFDHSENNNNITPQCKPPFGCTQL